MGRVRTLLINPTHSCLHDWGPSSYLASSHIEGPSITLWGHIRISFEEIPRRNHLNSPRRNKNKVRKYLYEYKPLRQQTDPT